MAAITTRNAPVVRPFPLGWWAALSLGAAAIHFAVIPEHLDEWWAFGLAFAALAWFQAAWPFAFLARPTARAAWVSIVINLATVGVWAWSRTSGLPVGPEPGMPEALGAPDLVASALELVLAGGLLVTLARGSWTTDGVADAARVTTLAAWVIVAVVTTVALVLGGG